MPSADDQLIPQVVDQVIPHLVLGIDRVAGYLLSSTALAWWLAAGLGNSLIEGVGN